MLVPESAHDLPPALPLRLARDRLSGDDRTAFALLFALDLRLGEVALRAGEPVLRQLRLAWWAEALSGQRPEGEVRDPLLRSLSARPDFDSDLLVDLCGAWSELGERGNDVIEPARRRARAVFGAAGKLVGQSLPPEAGLRWALADLERRGRDTGAEALSGTMAGMGQPLSMLWPKSGSRRARRMRRALIMVEELTAGIGGSPLVGWWRAHWS